MYYLVIGILLVLAKLLYFKLALKFGMVDKPNERSSHTRTTLRGGGIIFYIGVLLYVVFYGFSYIWFFVGLSLISFISFVDDLRSVSQKIRLVFHFSAMGFLFYQWDIFHYPWWVLIAILIVCTGIINVYNFMDGINGMTGGYSLVLLLFVCYVNTSVVPFIDPAFLYVVILSLLVFNFCNFRTHARCFAGDVGSVGMAFILIFCLGRLMIATEDISWIVVLSVYGVDAVWTIVHRMALKENIILPHRKHVYQIMANELKIPHISISLVYMVLQLVIDVGYIYARMQGYTWMYICVCILILSGVYVLFMKKYYYLHQTVR